METLDAIRRRRSIRNYTEEMVTSEEIEILLKAAFSAPTAVNTQPWEFVVINEQEVLDKIKEKMVFARFNAPLGIVVCGNMKYALKGQDKDLWICDCSAAIQNMLLAATDIGLASVWIGIYPIPTRMATMQKLIDLPEHVKPLGMVYFGHGTYEEPARCRYNEKAVYWQKYDNERKHRAKDKPVMGHYS
jgi:nitroreductase